METKQYRIVKNMLWPVKSFIEIGPDHITSKGKTIYWKDISGISCHIQSVNKGMNYIIAIDDTYKNSIYINIVHNMFASKKKKALFAEIYNNALNQIQKHHVVPKAEKMLEEIRAGKELTIEGIKVSKDAVEITIGLIKKEKIKLPIDDVEIVIYEGTGGFRISSKSNEKNFQHVGFGGLESRYLYEVIFQLTRK